MGQGSFVEIQVHMKRFKPLSRPLGIHQFQDDLRGCAGAQPIMCDTRALRALCLQSVAAAGLHPVGELFHRFPQPGGGPGMVLLAESHLAVHTWPELGAVTLDVYVCNLGADNSARAQALLAALQSGFRPASVEHHRVLRGGAPLAVPGGGGR